MWERRLKALIVFLFITAIPFISIQLTRLVVPIVIDEPSLYAFIQCVFLIMGLILAGIVNNSIKPS